MDLATDLRAFGGIHGGVNRACDFLCLTLKMLQIQPEREIVVEFIRNEDYKYVRCLGAFCGVTGKPLEVYGVPRAAAQHYGKYATPRRRRKVPGAPRGRVRARPARARTSPATSRCHAACTGWCWKTRASSRRRSALEDEDAGPLAGDNKVAGDGENPPGDGGDGDERRARETSAEREKPPEKRREGVTFSRLMYSSRTMIVILVIHIGASFELECSVVICFARLVFQRCARTRVRRQCGTGP